MTQSYAYDGEQTCAADGMCQEKCPVKINTGDMIKVGAETGGAGAPFGALWSDGWLVVGGYPAAGGPLC